MWFIIGSRAAEVAFGEFYRSLESSDWDIYTTAHEFQQWLSSAPPQLKRCFPMRKGKCRLIFSDTRTMEVCLYDQDTLFQFIERTPEVWHNRKVTVPHIGEVTTLTPQCLTLLKKSHLFWNINWEKNHQDYQWMQKFLSLESLTPQEEHFYERAYEKMSTIHSNKPRNSLG